MWVAGVQGLGHLSLLSQANEQSAGSEVEQVGLSSPEWEARVKQLPNVLCTMLISIALYIRHIP